jgi:hypothetical protein
MKFQLNKDPFFRFFWFYLGMLLIIGYAFLATSCATQKRCNEKFPAEKFSYDSLGVVERIIIKDTVITIPGAAIHDTIPVIIDCDKNGVGTIRPVIKTNASGHVSQSVIAAGNYILANCKADSLKQVIERQQKEISKNSSQFRKESKPVITNVIPGFYKFQNWVAMIFEALIILFCFISLPGERNKKQNA